MTATLKRQDGDDLIFHGNRVDFILRPVRTSSGGVKKKEVVLPPGAVLILPLLDDGRIVLVRNRRHTVEQTLLELPAGTLERDEAGNVEDPLVCARRELTEETGYRAAKVEPMGWFYTSPGILTEKMYVFLATGLTAGAQELDESEQIEVAVMSPDQVRQQIKENLLVDAKSIATLLKYFIGHCRLAAAESLEGDGHGLAG
jgi:ADP-ribose pyrophosphatase